MNRHNYSPAFEGALALLEKLIAEGVEFPDATAKVHAQSGFSVDELRTAYDNNQEEG